MLYPGIARYGFNRGKCNDMTANRLTGKLKSEKRPNLAKHIKQAILSIFASQFVLMMTMYGRMFSLIRFKSRSI